jgi:murein DD-endopeptidase MepM/ murein hydrolase activator NlpD
MTGRDRHPFAVRAALIPLLLAPVLIAGQIAVAAPPPSTPTTPPVPTEPTTTTTTTTTTTVPTTTVATTVPTTPAPTAPPSGPTCSPPTTTTTTTTLAPGQTTTTTTTTTTTLAPGQTTTSTTTTTTLPPCPTTTTVAPAPPPPSDEPAPDPGEPAPAPLNVRVPKQLSDILLTIRLVESGNRYTIGKNKGGASGAYQYIDSTWGNYKGYPSAYLAPPNIQDERALADVNSILWNWKGDVSMVPVIWYYPRAARDPKLMDLVPLPQAGNRLTVREYQKRWLDMLEYVTGAPLGFRLALLPPELRFLSGIPPEVAAPSEALLDVAYPVMGRSFVSPPPVCNEDTCDVGTDAIVFGIKLQPVMAVADGVITAVEEGDPVSGEVGVTIVDAFGRTFTYRGFNDDNPGTDDGAAPRYLRLSSYAQVGNAVRAGQIIGFMGDTDPMPSTEHRGIVGGDPIWPHLRLSIHNAQGVQLDADALLESAQTRRACHVAIGPWSIAPEPALDDVDVDDVKVDAILDGFWTIHDDGTVTANGKTALIMPPQGCQWAPDKPYGPGAAGGLPTTWKTPVEVPVRFRVGATVSTLDSPIAPVPAV